MAEGLAIEEGWGHPRADEDNMVLTGGLLGVHVPQGRRPAGRAALRYRPEGCPPAYCKIEVTDVHAVMGVEVIRNEQLGEECVHRSDGVNWLNTYNALRRLQCGHFPVDNTSGPAGQSGDDFEWIPTLVCSDAHPDMDQNYLHRPRRGWPSPQQLKIIKQFPMLLVLTGHKLSHPDQIPLQARFSWSVSEMVLIMELPDNIKQIYIAVKYAFKHFMKVFRGTEGAVDGRSTVGSYYLKTVFLRLLERRPPTMIRSQLDLLFGLLNDLDGYLDAGKLPHYFLPECDLLATVAPEERRLARDVIKHILSDPLRAILTCPVDSEEIYGEVGPDTLISAFHRVSSHPSSVRNREHLLWLLHCLDETRWWRYRRQLKHDGYKPGRPQLRGLVNMLRKQLHENWTCEIKKHLKTVRSVYCY